MLAGTGARIFLSGVPAHLYFVSPGQINFLVPSNLRPGRVKLWLVRDGRLGPEVEVRLRPSSPALYESPPGMAIATRPDGSVATEEDPARPGNVVILYATGLGQTQPRTLPGEMPRVLAMSGAVRRSK